MNRPEALVVDASVAIKWHLHDEDLVEEAGALLREHADRKILLTAPAFIRYELANSLEQARRRDRLSNEQVSEELRLFLELGIHATEDVDELLSLARTIAERAGTSVYDAVYLAHAERLGLGFVTHDARLARRAEEYPVIIYRLAEVSAFL